MKITISTIRVYASNNDFKGRLDENTISLSNHPTDGDQSIVCLETIPESFIKAYRIRKAHVEYIGKKANGETDEERDEWMDQKLTGKQSHYSIQDWTCFTPREYA